MHRLLLLSLLTAFLIAGSISNSFASTDSACLTPADHEAVLFLLIDRSDSIERKDAFEQSLMAAKRLVQPGERLVVAALTDKLSNARLLLDVTRPQSSIWDSKIKFRKKENAFNDCFQALKERMLAKDESAKSSAILETLGFAAQILSSETDAPKKRLVMYSDMVQNSQSLSFYKKEKFDVPALLTKVEKEQLLHAFNGAEVFISGTGGSVSDKASRGIQAFWKEYFKKAGATVSFYGPILVGVQ